MPKEVIHSTGSASPNQVQVGWSRDNYVEVGTTASGSEEDGRFAHLDRKGLNHLIRILRRARDQAFGRDE